MWGSLLIKWLSQRRGSTDRGTTGERLAERFLRQKPGWKLVARNWRNPRDKRDELDLVMRDGPVLVFVEVKTRSSRAKVSGVWAVDRRKRTVLRRTIKAYLRGLGESVAHHRCDIVEVVWPESESEGDAQVHHYENVSLQ
jgi:putative endonuclease